MKILVTGSNGFIAKNLIQFLSEKPEVEVLKFNRNSTPVELEKSVLAADLMSRSLLRGISPLLRKLQIFSSRQKSRLRLFFLHQFRQNVTMPTGRVNLVVSRYY